MTDSFENKPCSVCVGTGKVRTRTKSGNARRSRNKGNSSELDIAKQIAEAISVPYTECRRTPNSGALIERGDLRLSNRALERFPYFVEVKNRSSWDFWQLFGPKGLEGWEPYQWYKEAEGKAKSDAANGFGDGVVYTTLLVLMQNHRPTLCMTFLGEYLQGELMDIQPILKVDDFSIVRFKDLLAKYKVA